MYKGGPNDRCPLWRAQESHLLTKGGGRKDKVCPCVLEVVKPFGASQRSEGGLVLRRVLPDPHQEGGGRHACHQLVLPYAHSLVSHNQAYSELGTPQTPVGIGENHHSLLWGTGGVFLQDDSLWSDQRFPHACTGLRSLTDVGWESWGPRLSPRVLEKDSWRHSWAAMWRTLQIRRKGGAGCLVCCLYNHLSSLLIATTQQPSQQHKIYI